MLLAAGEGRRLRPFTQRVPKCMLPLAGKPLLEYNVERLASFGVKEILINLFHLPHVVQDHFGDGHEWGVKIRYSLEKTILGTAGGVGNARWFFQEPFFVWYGDNLSTCNLRRFYQFHREKGGIASIALTYREEVSQSGIVSLDEQSQIPRFVEKPDPGDIFSHWVNVGLLVLEREVLDYVPRTRASDFGRDIFPSLLADQRHLFGYQLSPDEGLWWIDRVQDLQRVQALLEGSCRSRIGGSSKSSRIDNSLS